MSVSSAQSITVLFTTRVFSTGVGTNADSLPTGTLYVNGTANGATVTVTNISTGLYKAAVTLPTLAIGDEVEIAIAATVSTIADKAVIWGDTKDILLDASGDVTFNNTSIATVTTVTTATNLTNAPPDSSGVGTLLTRIGGNITISGGKVAATMGSTDYSGNTVQAGDAYARIGAAGVGLTNLGDTRIAHLDADISSRGTSTLTQTQVTGGAYALNSSSFAFNSAFDFTTTQKTSLDTEIDARLEAFDPPTNAEMVARTLLAASYGTAANQATIISAVGTPQQAGSAVVLPTIPTDWIAAAGVKADAVTKIQAGLSTYAGGDTAGTTTLLSRVTAAVALASQIPANFTTGLFSSAGVFSVGALVNAPTGGGGGNVTVGGYAAGQDPATLVLDPAASGHNIAGSIGAKINAAGGAADPLLNAVPGSYASGTAGAVLGSLLAAPITTVGPVNPTTGVFTVIRGDDYFTADNRALTLACPVGTGIPDLTGLTVTVKFVGPAGAVDLTMTASATSPGGSSQAVTIQPTRTQTAGLISAQYSVVYQTVTAHAGEDTFGRAVCNVQNPAG
jgi:hypothetical protein